LKIIKKIIEFTDWFSVVVSALVTWTKLREARSELGLVTIFIQVTQAHSAWPSLRGYIGAICTGDDLGHRWGRNGEFCAGRTAGRTVSAGLPAGLPAYAAQVYQLKALSVNLSRPSVQHRLYASLIASNPPRLKTS